jgi:hypothetical protein
VDPSGQGTNNFAADVVVTFAADGAVVLGSLVGHSVPASTCYPLFVPGACGATPVAGMNQLDLVVWRSTDGGKTFGALVTVSKSTGTFTYAFGGPMPFTQATGSYPDREALVRDDATGTLYMAWSQVAATGFDVVVSKSTDGGASWSAPLTVTTGWYGVSLAALNDTVLVSFRGFQGQESITGLARSTDGGATWSKPQEFEPNAYLNYQPAPVALWARGAHALLAVPTDNNTRLVLHHSTDGGATWGTGIDALAPRATGKRLPALALDAATGRGVLTTYQGSEADAQVLEAWAVPLAGPRAGAPVRLGNGTVTADRAFDYVGADAASGAAWLTWTEENEQGGLAVRAARVTWV